MNLKLNIKSIIFNIMLKPGLIRNKRYRSYHQNRVIFGTLVVNQKFAKKAKKNVRIFFN